MTEFARKRLETKIGTFDLLFNGFAPLTFFLDSVGACTVNGVEYKDISMHGKAPFVNGECVPDRVDYRQPYMHRADYKDASSKAGDTVLKHLMPLVADTVKNDVEFMKQTAEALHQMSIDRLTANIAAKTAERDTLNGEIAKLEEERQKLTAANPPTL